MEEKGPKTQIDRIEEAVVVLTESTAKRFDQFEQRFTHIEEVVDTLAKASTERFDRIEEVIDGLARAVKEGFELTSTKVEMAEGFEGINSRIEGINRRIDSEVDQRIELGLRVEKVEAKVFPELQRQ